ncbi:macrophage colony-stimulating factor 1a isoform X3 [Amia ocellicauda]|uniref:macrophage colony-stimulating factor 1a isoform X3 n=1 Tax=Amia ocellicauda TaxID=2972642 RepID=UPI003464A826
MTLIDSVPLVVICLQATHLCFLVLLCFHLALGDVPGPCKHSVTRDHLKKVNSLIANQLQNGCSITYTFTEQQHLSNTCYVKAAFPKILELLTTHFKYGQSSENFNYVQDMKALVKHIYIQRCIPEINLQLEEDPAKFVQTYTSSPREALERVRKVLSLYMDLMTNSNGPVNWNCEEQYSVEVPESTTILSQSTADRLGSQEPHMNSILTTEEPAGHSGKGAQNGASEVTNATYKISFITVAVCGGLLLTIALYCYWQKKKPEVQLHRSEMERLDEDQRDIEITAC